MTLLRHARLFALLNMAMADAGIACWEAKYFFEFWRPITAIRLADTDGNPLTEEQSDWASLLPTPAYPEYPSGHGFISGAAQRVLTTFFGSSLPVSGWSEAFGDTYVRTWPNFAAVAEEAYEARIYAGFHFRFAMRDARKKGRAIGDYVVRTAALPLREGKLDHFQR
jgi:PAP2 superfamily